MAQSANSIDSGASTDAREYVLGAIPSAGGPELIRNSQTLTDAAQNDFRDLCPVLANKTYLN